MLIIGIDPGLDGAVAFLWEGDHGHPHTIDVHDMPTLDLERYRKRKREVAPRALVDCLYRSVDGQMRVHVFVEQAGAMPKQGVSSAFAFGKSYGIILGILAAGLLSYTVIPPQKWKRALSVPSAKDGARARASQLMPQAAYHWPLKKHDGRAEAALIAYYGWRELGGSKDEH